MPFQRSTPIDRSKRTAKNGSVVGTENILEEGLKRKRTPVSYTNYVSYDEDEESEVEKKVVSNNIKKRKVNTYRSNTSFQRSTPIDRSKRTAKNGSVVGAENILEEGLKRKRKPVTDTSFIRYDLNGDCDWDEGDNTLSYSNNIIKEESIMTNSKPIEKLKN